MDGWMDVSFFYRTVMKTGICMDVINKQIFYLMIFSLSKINPLVSFGKLNLVMILIVYFLFPDTYDYGKL